MKKKKIAILGATGSIGTQALEVVRANIDLFEVVLLSANTQVEALASFAREFSPQEVVIVQKGYYGALKEALDGRDIRVSSGEKALIEAVKNPEIELVLSALVGYSGLLPTMAAIQSGKTIALANKETLVVAGELIMDEAVKRGVDIFPVDSEHSAIFQCLMGEKQKIEKLILTASGGPFRGFSLEQLDRVTPQQALKHPNWNMGAKVTIDSASLMNKGFEMIEAHWLFSMPADKIEVLVHPQSIVHSMVQFTDGSVKAQLGLPDMRLPIGLALGLGERIANNYPRLDFTRNDLSFEFPNRAHFPNLTYAYKALEIGGTMPCVLNAANEVAVAAFLKERIGFRAMSLLLEDMMVHTAIIQTPTIDDLVAINEETRRKAEEEVSSGRYHR